MSDNPIREAVNNLPGHWYQGGYSPYDDSDSYCGLGHTLIALSGEQTIPDAFHVIANVPEGEEKWYKSWQTLTNAAADKFPERATRYAGASPNFANFNDHADTTEQDVIEVMELAAERWAVENEG